jgi:hypothetical protein
MRLSNGNRNVFCLMVRSFPIRHCGQDRISPFILDEHFIKKPITGDQPFLDKFRHQLESTPGAIKQLAAEMLWLLLLFPTKIGGPKKRHNIMEVWSWSGENLDGSHPLLLILDRGVGSAGQAFNQRRDLELAFVIRLAQSWKQARAERRASLIDDPWAFGNWLDGIPDAANRGFRHMILFLLSQTSTNGQPLLRTNTLWQLPLVVMQRNRSLKMVIRRM